MPQITQIEPQKKKTERLNVYLDGEYAFSASRLSVLENNLKVGKTLSASLVLEIITKENLAKLTDLAVRFLSYRPRSEKEVVSYLIRKIAQKENIKANVAQENPLIAKIIVKLKRYNYLNDKEFTRWYLSSRLRSSPRSRSQVRFELAQKGIDPQIVESTTSKFPNDSKLALAALNKKLRIWKNFKGLELKKKIYQYLAGRGFNYETIKEVFADLIKKG